MSHRLPSWLCPLRCLRRCSLGCGPRVKIMSRASFAAEDPGSAKSRIGGLRSPIRQAGLLRPLWRACGHREATCPAMPVDDPHAALLDRCEVLYRLRFLRPLRPLGFPALSCFQLGVVVLSLRYPFPLTETALTAAARSAGSADRVRDIVQLRSLRWLRFLSGRLRRHRGFPPSNRWLLGKRFAALKLLHICPSR